MLATVTRGLVLLLMIGLVTSEISPEQDSSLNQVADNSVERSGKMSSSSTRSVLAEMAREMIMRSTTNSQVLSLNLTNLFILLVLKALLFGAGLFSFGFLKNGGGYYARSGGEPLFSDPRTNPLVTENEILLLVSYLMGDANNDFTCLHRIACEEPAKAREYLIAAKMLIKGAKMFNTVVPYNPKYEAVVGKFQEAVELGSSGAKCGARYSCSSRSSR